MLVGMMGAGKTSVGRLCARKLGREFVDTDELVEARSESTVAEIFESEGEAGFRRLERDVVVSLAAAEHPLVISCGGGVVLDPANRQTLRAAGVVVWLRAAPAILAHRVGSSGTVRPLIASGGATTTAETLESIAAARSPLYEEVADLQVETDGRTIPEVADAVLEVYAP